MKRYTEEELIEWIKGFETINDMVKANMSMYYAARRKNLMEHFPPRQRRGPRIDEDKIRQEQERKALKQAEMTKKAEEKSRLKEESKNKDTTTPANMYKGEELDNGNIICGRCLEEKTERGRNYRGICRECYLRCMTLRSNGWDTNKWNIRDEYCHTVIRHHEKTFEIGIKVDERTERYLKLIGYDFIFKEPYDK